MFVIDEKQGGHRPVFNLKRLNQYLIAPHFRMETLHQVVQLLRPNDYMTSIDLSDAFLHILIHKHSRRYLRFRFENQTFPFRTAAFGLAVVPFLFTRLCKPILAWARLQGIRVSAYLDDWLLLADSKLQATQQTQSLLMKLQELGWIINLKKSHLVPSQRIEHLGFNIDSTSMTAQLPGAKIRDLRRSISALLKQPWQTPRRVHSLTMRIKAATIAIFPVHLYTQALMRFKNQQVRRPVDWDIPRPLPQDCLDELQLWHRNISIWNGRSLLQPSQPIPSTSMRATWVGAPNWAPR